MLQILYQAMGILIIITCLLVLVWGYFFGKETDRMMKEYTDKKERLDKILRSPYTIKQTEFNPGVWIATSTAAHQIP